MPLGISVAPEDLGLGLCYTIENPDDADIAARLSFDVCDTSGETRLDQSHESS